jgi:hypothetical protein
MTTAVIGTGGIGSIIARELASGGEALRLSSADGKSARMLAAEIGRGAVASVDNRDAWKVGGIGPTSRLEVGGDLHDLVVGPAEARSLIGKA